MSDWTKVESGVMPTVGERVRVRFIVGKKAPFVMQGVGVWDGKEWSRLYPENTRAWLESLITKTDNDEEV